MYRRVARIAAADVSDPAKLRLLLVHIFFLKGARLHLHKDFALDFSFCQPMTNERANHVFLDFLIRTKPLCSNFLRNSSEADIRQNKLLLVRGK
jgi:hypothetical protein